MIAERQCDRATSPEFSFFGWTERRMGLSGCATVQGLLLWGPAGLAIMSFSSWPGAGWCWVSSPVPLNLPERSSHLGQAKWPGLCAGPNMCARHVTAPSGAAKRFHKMAAQASMQILESPQQLTLHSPCASFGHPVLSSLCFLFFLVLTLVFNV